MKSFKMHNTIGVVDKLKSLGYKQSAQGTTPMYGAYIYCVAGNYTITPAMHYWHGLELPLAEFNKAGELVEAIKEFNHTSRKCNDYELLGNLISEEVENLPSEIEFFQLPPNSKVKIKYEIIRNVK